MPSSKWHWVRFLEKEDMIRVSEMTIMRLTKWGNNNIVTIYFFKINTPTFSVLPTDSLRGTVSIFWDLELHMLLQIVPVQLWNTLFSGMNIPRTSASCLLMHHCCCSWNNTLYSLHQKCSSHVSNWKLFCGDLNWGNGLISENSEQRITGCGRLEFQNHSKF